MTFSFIKNIYNKIDLYKFFIKARDSYIEFHAHAQFKIRFVCIIGTIGFPAYYIIWKYVLPQPYENLTLRVLGCILSALLVVAPYWPKSLKKYHPVYSYIAMTYGLPFFFTYMLLMNDANIVWQLSSMTALLFVALLFDAVNMFLSTLIGASIAVIIFLIQTDTASLPDGVWVTLPITIFTFIGIMSLNYSNDVITKEKLKTASSLASHIAHEMRTPLLGVKLEAEKIGKYIPIFLESYIWARENGWDSKKISKSQLRGIDGSMKRIKEHSISANLMIDMLLMNVKHSDVPTEEFSLFSMKKTIHTALERYHFRSGEKELITFEDNKDFECLGTEILFTHVIFNLLRNSLRAIHAKGEGNIKIRLEKGLRKNYMIFSDTGEGIDPDFLKYIFIPFFSGEKNNLGNGIGLSFTKYVIESFGGEISCESKLGKGTKFIIALPSKWEKMQILN